MKKEITISVPTDWSGVTLKQYLNLMRDLEVYSDNEEAMTAALFHHLCGMNVEWINVLDIETYIKIKGDLYRFMNNKSGFELQRIITIDGEEYGFEPNLSKLAYGAYVDISKYGTLEINDKWGEILSILYRRVTYKVKDYYDIEEYDGELYPGKFMDLGMDFHFGALFFLLNLQMDLLNATRKYLMEKDLPHNIRLILEKNGVHTPV